MVVVGGLFFVSRPLLKTISPRRDPTAVILTTFPWVKTDYHPIGMPAMFVGEHAVSVFGLASRRLSRPRAKFIALRSTQSQGLRSSTHLLIVVVRP